MTSLGLALVLLVISVLIVGQFNSVESRTWPEIYFMDDAEESVVPAVSDKQTTSDPELDELWQALRKARHPCWKFYGKRFFEAEKKEDKAKSDDYVVPTFG